jgi:outer membrane receptor protein involved in Fe transport
VAPYAADPQWTDQTLPYGTDRTREDYGMARIDHKFNNSTTAYVRGNIDSAHLDQPADSAGARTLTDITPENIVFALQKVFSALLTNEAKFGVNPSVWTPIVHGSAPLDLSVGGDVPWSGLTGNSKQEEAGTTFSVIDNLTQSRGRNSFKYGIDIRRIRLNNSGNAITTSSIDYTSFSNFQHNLADSMTLDVGQGLVGLRRTFYMGYAQDEVKLTPNLTLNAGLRYEFYSVMHEVLGRSLTVSAACGGFCPEGAPFYQPNTKDFGPRFGVSWAPSALKEKTVIRTVFGLYFGANQNDDFSDPTESVAPRYSASTNLPALQLYYGYDLLKPGPLVRAPARKRSIRTGKTCTTKTGTSTFSSNCPSVLWVKWAT